MTSAPDFRQLAAAHGIELDKDASMLRLNGGDAEYFSATAREVSGAYWVLRAPRRGDVQAQARTEKRVLDFVRGKVPVRDPGLAGLYRQAGRLSRAAGHSGGGDRSADGRADLAVAAGERAGDVCREPRAHTGQAARSRCQRGGGFRHSHRHGGRGASPDEAADGGLQHAGAGAREAVGPVAEVDRWRQLLAGSCRPDPWRHLSSAPVRRCGLQGGGDRGLVGCRGDGSRRSTSRSTLRRRAARRWKT